VIRTVIAIALAALLSACATSPVVVNYRPSPTSSALPAEAGYLVVSRFVDDRGEPPKWVGAIRGGFGNPLKVIEVDESASVVVQTAFAEGVRARGAAGTSGAKRFEVRGTIKKLDSSQYVRREAHGVIEVAIVDTASGRELFRRTYSADQVEGSLVTFDAGIFASPQDLKKVLEQVLNQIVDKALDDPDLRAVLKG
jgi:uncharacterized lipoprotein YajG